MPDPAGALDVLLRPYADPDPRQAGRLIDVPPAVAVEALALLPRDLAETRLNLTQPPMRWLVECAADLGGRLVGAIAPGRAAIRFDGVQVDLALARQLAERVAEAWPAAPDVSAALSAAVAEAWPSWSPGERPLWTGGGTDLLTQQLPSGAAVVGLWWD
ncbi:hypothetical protein ACI78V_02020 [Geodermatophilus sp. SYSU D00742]